MEQRAHFSSKLDELKMLVLRMAALSEEAVHRSMKAFFELDGEMAEDVINMDCEINNLEDEVDKFVVETLALDQPMATDLRFLVGCNRISSNLERLGDEAVNLAHRALFLSTRPSLPFNQKLEQMAENCKKMLDLATKSFVERDVLMAERVCNLDNEVDELNIKLLKEYINGMVTESRVVERGVHSILAVRHLERIADLSTNVAESVIFIVEGDNVKHRCKS